jgi:predicted GIY-YIG superfamily endonuclease
MSCVSVYLLELLNDADEPRWYVGISQNPKSRIQAHYNGNGAKWIEGMEVVDDHIIISNVTRGEAWRVENELTEFFIHSHGKDAARGGRYVGMAEKNIPEKPIDDFQVIVAQKLMENELTHYPFNTAQ